jgi:hypothetical protein
LLAITDHEDRAVTLLILRPIGEELRRQGANDRPLLGICILRLVDQQMVDATIQLVENPGGVAFDQAAGDVDQIVVIQQCPGAF